ncbi:hypothetical protein GCM10028806_56740 [Spirosoma terrae]|uniref:Uncharacterized protein n=1 Tax=Spirosoma terrae TaxID=1968276 RepID=A0A6L9LJQ6_9BACT|nr:hypothetical protein [Spirosoma terrae]NDU96869.1 hypothetical protein [Spirosoma terrae]
MSIIAITVLLQGKDQLHEPKLILEGLPITIRTLDGEKWENSSVKLPVDNVLNIRLEVFGVRTTEWTLTINYKLTGDELYKKKSEIGKNIGTDEPEDVNTSILVDKKELGDEKDANITEINV